MDAMVSGLLWQKPMRNLASSIMRGAAFSEAMTAIENNQGKVVRG